jgi:hypothetical protein
MVIQLNTTMFENTVKVSFEKIYSALQNSEADYHARQNSKTDSHAEQPYDPDPEWVPTLTAAVKQFAPLAGGGFMSLQNLLSLMCIPATVGRSSRMLEMLRTQSIDWQTAFANTSEDRQAESGGGKRTRAYERVKKARQRLVNASDTHINLLAESTVSTIVQSLPSPFVADCALNALDWCDNGKSPGPLLCLLAGRLVSEAYIADEAALSQAANTILREAALRFIALQSGPPLEPA